MSFSKQRTIEDGSEQTPIWEGREPGQGGLSYQRARWAGGETDKGSKAGRALF